MVTVHSSISITLITAVAVPLSPSQFLSVSVLTVTLMSKTIIK